MNFGLKGKTALVLAASKGLGKASAFALAMEGADIVICARDEKALKQTAQEISKKTKTKILAIPCDVTKLSDLEHLVKKTIKEFGKIDILVNNAGGPPPSTFETTTDEQWQNAFELLLLNAIRTIRLVLPHMKQTGSGRIINMTSVSVKQPSNNLILSNAIRAGVTGMAKTLSNEIAADNITVNNICTGYFLTDRIKSLHNIDKKIKQGMTEQDAFAAIIQDIPMKRMGKPEEYGALVAFLASEQAGYITGTSIQIDGGRIHSLL